MKLFGLRKRRTKQNSILFLKKRVIAGIKPSPFGFEGQALLHIQEQLNDHTIIHSFIHSYADNSVKFSGSQTVSSKMITFLS